LLPWRLDTNRINFENICSYLGQFLQVETLMAVPRFSFHFLANRSEDLFNEAAFSQDAFIAFQIDSGSSRRD